LVIGQHSDFVSHLRKIIVSTEKQGYVEFLPVRKTYYIQRKTDIDSLFLSS